MSETLVGIHRAKFIKAGLLILLLNVITLSESAFARLTVCNNSDLVMMVAAAYDTDETRVVSEGWWKIFPGFCQETVNLPMLSGNYYFHAESSPISTVPVDSFSMGEGTVLCVVASDFRNPNAAFCEDGEIAVGFTKIEKNWRNSHTIAIDHSKRRYKDEFATRVAGVQRMLTILGFEIGVIDGVLGKNTLEAINAVSQHQQLVGMDFQTLYPALENLILNQMNLGEN